MKPIFDVSVSNKQANFKKWNSLILLSAKEYHFLLILMPVMESLFSQLKQTIKKYPNFAYCAKEEFLTQFILKNFKANVNPMIIRVCVLEMHILSQQGLLAGETSEKRFSSFIKVLVESKNKRLFFKKYPVLKEQIEIYRVQFLLLFEELLNRLEHDYDELLEYFLEGERAYQLSIIEEMGDRHNQGRAVMILEFEHQQTNKKIKLLYKPRSLAMDVAFQDFIHRFNSHANHLKLLTLKVINKNNYGWCEFIDHLPCQNKEEIKNFYYRMGIILMLSYLLKGDDLHAENLIAHSEYPVLIDYECFLNPFYAMKKDAHNQLSRFLVNDMTILPGRFVVGKASKGIDMSALGSQEGEETSFLYIKWLDAGKDTMHAQRLPVKTREYLNKPKLLNQNVQLLDYKNEFLQGFEETYLCILNHFPLLFNELMLNQFKDLPIRIVFRLTTYYGILLSESWHPDYLCKAKARKSYFSILKNIINQSFYYEKIINSELYDLNQNTIPLFSCSTSGKTIVDSQGKVIHIPIIKTGYECLLEHIQNHVNTEDLYLQKTLILASFEALELNQKTERIVSPAKQVRYKSLQLEELQSKALSIAKRELDELKKLHIIKFDTICWPTIAVKGSGIWVPDFTDIHLYDGLAGIALSFAYGAKILHDPQYAALAQQCQNSLHIQWKENKKEDIKTVGGFEGIGGLIYAFGRLFKLGKDECIKTDLHHFLGAIPPLLSNDKSYDIISGAAGCLAALMSLQGIIPKTVFMPYARACVRHILQNYPYPSQFPRFYATESKQPLLGFSHGVAGIAWALHRYFLLEPRLKVKRWIQAALDYERAEFNKEAGNWPDFRKDLESDTFNTKFMTAWCHGASGIGLARLDMAKKWHDGAIHKEIQLALQTTAKEGFGSYECLCHGNLGNLELFLNAARFFQGRELTRQYYQLATKILTTIDEGSFQCGLVKNFAAPGLMTGRAGVAYQMLRIADAENVPSLLLMN
ncbi:MAG: type 2 lantipeptide synthetase LanM [Tatlockia sp.]|nr:type 2 lantipeptide synthetase LanM [Tatlockia sp.]